MKKKIIFLEQKSERIKFGGRDHDQLLVFEF